MKCQKMALKLLRLSILTFSSKAILFAQPTAPSNVKQENVLKIGTLLDLSSNIRQCTEPLQKGTEFVFEKINQAGGIQGNKLSLFVIDDKYEPDLARTGVLDFINNYKIDTLLSPVGSPTLLAYLDLVKEGKVLVLFPTACDTRFHAPELKYLVHCRASYAQESEAMAQYALKTLKAQKIAIFYQSDIESVDGAEAYFKKVGFKEYQLLAYDRKSTSFDVQAKKIVDMNADTIFLICIPSAGLELLRKIGVEKLFGKNLICWSSLASDVFQQGLSGRGLKDKATIISALPNPKSDLPIAKEFMKTMQENNLVPDPWYFEGFMNATVFGAILRRIEGPITKESIIAAAEKMKDVDIGGLKWTFDPQARTLSSRLWIITNAGEWIEYKPETN